MSDFNSSSQVHNQYSMSNSQSPNYPPLDVPARPFPANMPSYHSTFSYESPNFFSVFPPQYDSSMSPAPSGPTPNSNLQPQHARVPQYPRFAPQPSYRPNSFYPHQGGSTLNHRGPNPSDPVRSFPNASGSVGQLQDFADSRNDMDLPPMMQPHGFPPFGSGPGGPMHGFNTFSGRLSGQNSQCPVPPPHTFGADAMSPIGPGRGPIRSNSRGLSEQNRHLTSPSRRTSYERQHQQSLGGPDRRPQSFLSAHPRRSDRSVSPRTSNRRSFDRYSTDLPSSSASLEEAEAANRFRATPQHRLNHHEQRRRQLQANREFRRSAYMNEDPNVPSASQMQALRDKLRHFLPNELPEDASAMCDICQKDYSTRHVNPCEEEEVAIQLPCKHVFGEHCINTWFETCKTHKNKITCPMCRKVLIEPMRSTFPPAELMALLAGNEARSSFAALSQEDRAMFMRFHGAMGRDLEGDFAHI
ncbi:hypothetical protein EJ04DRAFT_104216 [Polyplosphaeria fusca]|uniref:RING-type domain-containing protein n=1 Tax=Polyplosphaeria fusca TaxID=682080 RepID=A0A9P4V4D0_9PLEO|nr:hypothetical protein EJ04DRAFT_104216 [Polyplosphaeria fusca]